MSVLRAHRSGTHVAAALRDAPSGLGETGPRGCRLGQFILLGVAAVLLCSCQKVEPAAAPNPGDKPDYKIVQTKTGAEMVLIPAGSFLMGSADGEVDEAPPHEVTVDAFWMDRTEVTQEQYGRLVLGNPSHFKGADRPVEQISWADAALYCNLRSRSEGLEPCYDEETAKCNLQATGYRLPTEAEWEYACRAGAATPYAFGADPQQLGQYAWFADNAGKKTQPVARKKPNAWGLYDLHGNVAEWCNDVYEAEYYQHSPKENPPGPADGEKYVLRGGAWSSRSPRCRTAARVGENPGFQDACFARDAIGFRCVRRADANSTVIVRASPGPAGSVVVRLGTRAVERHLSQTNQPHRHGRPAQAAEQGFQLLLEACPEFADRRVIDRPPFRKPPRVNPGLSSAGAVFRFPLRPILCPQQFVEDARVVPIGNRVVECGGNQHQLIPSQDRLCEVAPARGSPDDALPTNAGVANGVYS